MIIPNLWLRLHFLVSNPECTTYSDDFDKIEWFDSRTQPTALALQNVTQAEMTSVKPQKAIKTRWIALKNSIPDTEPWKAKLIDLAIALEWE